MRSGSLNLPPEAPGEEARREEETLIRQEVALETNKRAVSPPIRSDRLLFIANRQGDGTYEVTLTEEGLQPFETALAIADDFGRKRTISERSSIADIMERTATREELSELLRAGNDGRLHRLRVAALRRQLWGSEKPTPRQATSSHVVRALIVLLPALWTIGQFGAVLADIGSVPGILGSVPGDILHLDLSAPFKEIQARITDAEVHLLGGLLGVLLVICAAALLKPLASLYRRDQVVPGERLALRIIVALLAIVDKRAKTRIDAPE